MQDHFLVMGDGGAPKALAQEAGAAYSDSIDFGAGKNAFGAALANQDPNSGKGGLYLNVKVTEAFAGTGATLVAALQDSADNSTFADTPVVSAALGLTALTLGATIFRCPLHTPLKRYVRMRFTTAVATTTAGKVMAWISTEAESQ